MLLKSANKQIKDLINQLIGEGHHRFQDIFIRIRMSNDTLSMETAALTLLDFVVPDASANLFSETTPGQKIESPRATEISENINLAIPLLSEGFLAHFIPTLTQVEEQLRELEKKQKVLLEEMQKTNTKMENQDNYEYIALSFSKIPQYHGKLQYIRNTMLSMLSRSKNLNQRVAQLKIMKEQQLAQIAEIQKRERNFDQTVLAAKVVEHNPPPAPKAIVVSSKILKKKKKEKTKEKGKGKEKVVRREIEFSSSSTSVIESKIEITKDTSFEKIEDE